MILPTVKDGAWIDSAQGINFSRNDGTGRKDGGWTFNSLVFHAHCDSDNRSQLVANLDDIVQALEVLDSSDTIPTIYCEASQLHRIPPLSLDPVAEQVHSNSQALNALSSVIEGLEKKLSAFLVSCASPAAACGAQPGVCYSTVASSAPSPVATHSSSVVSR